MKSYTVTVYEVHSYDLEIVANSEDEAREKANDLIETEAFIGEYDYTMDSDQWQVFDNGEIK